MCTFSKYRPLVDNEHVGHILPPRVGARRCLYYVLCLSVTKLFLVLFKHFIVIIKKVEMLYVVGPTEYNSMLSKQRVYNIIITFLVVQS